MLKSPPVVKAPLNITIVIPIYLQPIISTCTYTFYNFNFRHTADLIFFVSNGGKGVGCCVLTGDRSWCCMRVYLVHDRSFGTVIFLQWAHTGDSTLRTLHLEPKIGIWNSCQTFIQPTKLLKLVHWITLVTPYIFSRKKIICSQDLWAVNWRRSVADITAKNNHIIQVPFLKLNFLWIEKTWEGHKM